MQVAFENGEKIVGKQTPPPRVRIWERLIHLRDQTPPAVNIDISITKDLLQSPRAFLDQNNILTIRKMFAA